jgi:hypothetical protein
MCREKNRKLRTVIKKGSSLQSKVKSTTFKVLVLGGDASMMNWMCSINIFQNHRPRLRESSSSIGVIH